MRHHLTIIGGGNLGSSMAEGLLNSNFISSGQLTITRRNIQSITSWKEKGVEISTDNIASVEKADYIILAVKPFQVKEILQEISPAIDPARHVVISVVTGVWINELREILGEERAIPIVRAMPNTAIAIKESMTCLCSDGASAEQLEFVCHLFNHLGKTVLIEEKLMDAATVLGACGTAFAMRYIRANIQGGIEIGFSAEIASLIAAQTVKGAAELLLSKNTHPEQEIDKVTTPKGCTIAGLNEMEHRGFSSSLIKGVVTSYRKIRDDM